MALDPKLVIVAVETSLGGLLALAFNELRGIVGAEGEALEKRCQADLISRSEQGQTPDWHRYLAQAERMFEARGDRLRTFASSALAIGLFGTLLFLVVTLYSASPSAPPNQAQNLVEETLKSLFGSLSGVTVHLVIALVLLRWAESRFARWVRGFEARLEDFARSHPVQPPFLPVLREELGKIRESLTGSVGSALADAVAGFPAVVTRLDGTVDRLVEVVERQGRSIDSAIKAVGDGASATALAGSALLPAAERLAAAVQDIQDLPSALRSTLSDSREQWLGGLREAQEERLREIVEAARRSEETARSREQQMILEVHALEAAVGEVQGAVGRIAADIDSQVEKMAGRLGTAFGREARTATREMADQVERAYRQLLERVEGHEQQWLNRIGTVVDELFARLGNSLNERLLGGLEGAGSALKASSEALSSITERLEKAHQEWNRVHGEALAGWQEAGRQIGTAAERLAGAEGAIRGVVESLGEGAGHLKALRPIVTGLETLLSEIRASQEQRDTLLKNLSEALTQAIESLPESAAA